MSISIVCGLRCTRPLIAAIAAGQVAENSRVCRSAGAKRDHLVDGVAEAHIEHAVRFIHHQGLQRVKGDGPLLQMIEQTARGGDDDMRGVLE